jgi:hypothetical protein
MGSPPRLRPGTSPQTFRIPPRGGHPVLRLPSRQTTNLGASPWLCPSFPTSCPFRVLLIHAPRPTRRYPRLWIWRPSSERLRDFNPPDLGAAQHTLRTSPPPQAAEPVPRGLFVGGHAPSPLGLPVLRTISWARMPSPLPRRGRGVRSLVLPSDGGGELVLRDGSLLRNSGGSAPASPFSGPARRSLALRPARSLNR